MIDVAASGAGRPGPEHRATILILLATAVLTIFYYWLRTDTIGVMSQTRPWTALTGARWSHASHNLAALLLLGLVPLTVARLWCGLSWSEAGLCRGRMRRSLFWLAVGLPVAALAGAMASGQPQMRAVYPLDPGLTQDLGPFVRHSLTQLLYISAWETLFRGVLLRGLMPQFGFATANAVQTALSVLAHFGRPFAETFSAIPAGLAFGGVTRHTGSLWPVILIHWAVGLAQDAFILFT